MHKIACRFHGALLALAVVPALCTAAEPETEDTQAGLQTTYVRQRKPAFSAAYSGANSLTPELEKRGYTLTTTAFLGTRTWWPGGALYFNPEMSVGQSLSGLHGLGGHSNGENQKGGGAEPTFYMARLFARQTWGFGGGTEKVGSAPNQLAGNVDKHRLVLTAGKLGLTDIFDQNSFSHDPRTQFLNWSVMAQGAFDYAADTRGYTAGAALEYYRDEWVFRAGRFQQPIESNGLALDRRMGRHYGDQAEIEHNHEIFGQPGTVRLLVFRNKARMGGFKDAVDFWNASGRLAAPDVGRVRVEQSKAGFGVNLEQNISGNMGLFLRASRNDGRTETYAFTEIERTVSGGILAEGRSWNRPDDTLGIAFASNGLSSEHREYLAYGGLGAFIGDGNISYRREKIMEVFYSLGVAKNVSLSIDYQHIANPAYNADRGPVNILGARFHAEF